MNAEHRNQLNLLMRKFAEKGVFPGYLDQLSALFEVVHASAYCTGVQAGQTLAELKDAERREGAPLQ